MRIAVAFLAIAAVLTHRPVGAEIIPICGDANNDGDISVSDGVSALRAAAELPSTCPLAVCDVNADGRITVTDGVNILRNAAGLPTVDKCRDVTSTPVPSSAHAPGADEHSSAVASAPRG
jgi:hypothetical protein